MTMRARLLAAIGAPLIGAATVSQGWLSVAESMQHGRTLAEGVWIYLCYFTVLTNLLVAATLARAALRPADRIGLNAPRVELMVATSILFVGIVYNLLLASQWDPQGLRKANDIILHDVSPLLFAGFWLMRRQGVLRWRDAIFTAAWPFAYTIYAQARGAIDGFYPYFFTDPTRMTWARALINMAGLFAAFAIGALALIMLDRALRRRRPA